MRRFGSSGSGLAESVQPRLPSRSNRERRVKIHCRMLRSIGGNAHASRKAFLLADSDAALNERLVGGKKSCWPPYRGRIPARSAARCCTTGPRGHRAQRAIRIGDAGAGVAVHGDRSRKIAAPHADFDSRGPAEAGRGIRAAAGRAAGMWRSVPARVMHSDEPALKLRV